MPRLPIEVVRRRVRRARQLGLPYATYARVYATTGQDIAALMFSSNALGILRPDDALDARRRHQLAGLSRCDILAAAQAPVGAVDLAARLEVEGLIASAFRAPDLTLTPQKTTACLARALAKHKLPRDRVLVIGRTALERDWSRLGQMAGYVDGAAYFAGQSAAHTP